MENHLGEEYDALIISVQKFGFFVELVDIFVEGLVGIDRIEDFTGMRCTYRERDHAIVCRGRRGSSRVFLLVIASGFRQNASIRCAIASNSPSSDSCQGELFPGTPRAVVPLHISTRPVLLYRSVHRIPEAMSKYSALVGRRVEARYRAARHLASRSWPPRFRQWNVDLHRGALRAGRPRPKHARRDSLRIHRQRQRSAIRTASTAHRLAFLAPPNRLCFPARQTGKLLPSFLMGRRR